MADPDSAREFLFAFLAWQRGEGPEARSSLAPLVDDAIRAAGGDARAALDAALADATPTVAESPTLSVGAAEIEGHVLLEALDALDAGGERYTLNRLHSKGGLGQVWLARDAALGREVAYKEIRPERAENPAVWTRFLREARITGLLEHPGIVPVYELSRRTETGRPFYTMRFVRGRTLTEAIAAYHARRAEGTVGALDLQALLTSFVGVANAVAYAHARGVIHRDLKGDNVIVGDFGETIVLDWGLAKRIDEADEPADGAEAPIEAGGTVEGQVLGTPAYMAPEQASGHLHAVGPRSDVHGLGAILYEILTGRPPFTGKDTGEVLRRVVQETPPRPRSLVPDGPAALEAICLKALAKDPEARYDSATAMAEDVSRFLADEPVTAWREPLVRRASRWARRHRTVVAAASVLLVTAVLSLSVGNVLLNRKQREIERQRAAAEANYRLAKGAVDHYLTTVADSAELKAKGLESLRRELFGNARSFYETFVKERSGDPGARADLGAANINLGNIARQTGETKQAEDSFGKAIDLYELLAREDPTVLSYRTDLIAAVGNLGLLYSETGRPKEAEATYQRAIALVEGAAPGNGDDPAYLAALGNTYDNLGTLLASARRLDESESAHTKGLRLRERLAKEFPDNEDYRRRILISEVNLSNLYASSGREAEAEPHLQAAAAIGEALVASHPEDPDAATGLAATYNNLGGVYTLLGRTADAMRAHERALAIRERLAAEHPTILDFQLYLAGSYVNVGELAVRAGRYDDAISELEKAEATLGGVLAIEPRHEVARFYLAYATSWHARALDALDRTAEGLTSWERAAAFNDRNYPTIPAGYALALARRGRVPEAIRQAEAVEKLEGLSGEVVYDLVATYAIASARSPEMRDAYAAHGTALLEKAKKLGYFKVPGAAEQAASDPDLAPLRAREEFDELVTP